MLLFDPMLCWLCLALRPGLSDAAPREGGSLSRPPFDFVAMAKNRKVYGDRETAHKVINRNLNRASGTIEEKVEVSACQPGLHAASACPTVPTPAPLPPSFARLLLHRPLSHVALLPRSRGCSFTAPL